MSVEIPGTMQARIDLLSKLSAALVEDMTDGSIIFNGSTAMRRIKVSACALNAAASSWLGERDG